MADSAPHCSTFQNAPAPFKMKLWGTAFALITMEKYLETFVIVRSIADFFQTTNPFFSARAVDGFLCRALGSENLIPCVSPCRVEIFFLLLQVFKMVTLCAFELLRMQGALRNGLFGGRVVAVLEKPC